MEKVMLLSSDSPKDSIYCHSSQHQPHLWHKASSKSQVTEGRLIIGHLKPTGFNDDLT